MKKTKNKKRLGKWPQAVNSLLNHKYFQWLYIAVILANMMLVIWEPPSYKVYLYTQTNNL